MCLTQTACCSYIPDTHHNVSRALQHIQQDIHEVQRLMGDPLCKKGGGHKWGQHGVCCLPCLQGEPVSQ